MLPCHGFLANALLERLSQTGVRFHSAQDLPVILRIPAFAGCLASRLRAQKSHEGQPPRGLGALGNRRIRGVYMSEQIAIVAYVLIVGLLAVVASQSARPKIYRAPARSIGLHGSEAGYPVEPFRPAI
jgi:hypothetical protein